MSADDCNVRLDALVVGAGFAGLYMLHRLRQTGFRALVVEAGNGVGGTWYWNRYPGARCDIESTQYSYQFSPELEQDWCWSERYATQAEILSYANHVADRFDLRRDIVLGTRISAATYDEVEQSWTLVSESGRRFTARFCIMATGCLSAPSRPAIDGLDRFAGTVHHTGDWPHHDIDFTGKRVAVIGTGSSGVQSTPVIARQASHLTVFQRTPAYSVPARNIALPPAIQAGIKATYRQLRARAKLNPTGVLFDSSPEKAVETPAELREREYERRWQRGGLTFLGAYGDLLSDEAANRTAAEFVRRKIRGIVADPAVAQRLMPTTAIGGKRLCVDLGYYETFNRPNVSLVDVSRTPIERITGTGIVVDGKEHEADIVVLATGFDAMTGALMRIDIRGRGGRSLREKWKAEPRAYLGLGISGFPNLLTITGPGSPSVLTNMLPSIEQHVEWISDCLVHLRSQELATIEPTDGAESDWAEHVAELARETLRATVDSWYLGANVPGKPRVFLPYPGGFPRYAAECERVAAAGYLGFSLEPSRAAAAETV
ncbi:MAG: NAD(P)/FAD-dependent oxidoreductase [Hyphomicrobiaceae bacterium]|nr:NAD(P)/FAD-dependent oxidoreductase [Hyphomicrobiaceae bacterium]